MNDMTDFRPYKIDVLIIYDIADYLILPTCPGAAKWSLKHPTTPFNPLVKSASATEVPVVTTNLAGERRIASIVGNRQPKTIFKVLFGTGSRA